MANNILGSGPRRRCYGLRATRVSINESTDTYFSRKYRELALIADGLRSAEHIPRPRTTKGIIEAKFRLAAALRAEHATAAWAHTETCWNRASLLRVGPFTFGYRYQRADLCVEGPLPYPFLPDFTGPLPHKLVYSCSGMAAISGLLQAIAWRGNCALFVGAGTYKETLEMVRRSDLEVRILGSAADGRNARATDGRILWLDSSSLDNGLNACSELRSGSFDLIACDTTCFAAHSGRIRRVIAEAQRERTPLVLVRSHAKLDSLGVEFGRLGSALFVIFPEVPLAKIRRLREIAGELHEAIRLNGTAPVPGNFCPFFATPEYWSLSAARGSAILRNSRLLTGTLRRAVGRASVRDYPHGMFAAVVPRAEWDERGACAAAEDLAHALSRKGYPVRHAGSFGFDFVATEAFFDTTLDRYVLRIAPGDLPSALFADTAGEIASWWRSGSHARAA